MTSDFTTTQFVADAIMTHIRAGQIPSNGDADVLDSRPLIDALRMRVSENDIPWMLECIENQSDSAAGLACSLLRAHSLRAEVRQCFESRWQTASPYLKNRLIWRMLDDPELPQALHREFFRFIIDEWDTFADFNRNFYGDGKKGIFNFVSKYETDKNEPPLIVLLAYARLMGIPAETLMDDKLDLPPEIRPHRI